MQITRVSVMSGITRTLEIPVTQEQLDSYNNGAKPQDAFPNLTDAEREFIQTGIIDAEWGRLFHRTR